MTLDDVPAYNTLTLTDEAKAAAVSEQEVGLAKIGLSLHISRLQRELERGFGPVQFKLLEALIPLFQMQGYLETKPDQEILTVDDLYHQKVTIKECSNCWQLVHSWQPRRREGVRFRHTYCTDRDYMSATPQIGRAT